MVKYHYNLVKGVFIVKGNVLVLGNSGVGKSTLINAVLGTDVAAASFGTEGTTKELKIYGPDLDGAPFNLIDSVGFEPNWFKARQAISAVKAWSKSSAKDGNEDTQINIVWFCIDGCSAKLFPETVENMTKAISMWKNIPVIVVITKSFSKPDWEKNIQMIRDAFTKAKKYHCNVKGIFPVVAQIYEIDETISVGPEGLSELVDKTLELMPEGMRTADEIIKRFRLTRKRAQAQTVTGFAVTSAVVVGAVPIPVPDAPILVSIETIMVNRILSIYDIKNDDEKKKFTEILLEIGAATLIGKSVINAVKAIPGISLAADVINAIVAGAVVSLMGETVCYVLDRVYLGKLKLNEYDKVMTLVKEKFTSGEITKYIESVAKIAEPLLAKTKGKKAMK